MREFIAWVIYGSGITVDQCLKQRAAMEFRKNRLQRCGVILYSIGLTVTHHVPMRIPHNEVHPLYHASCAPADKINSDTFTVSAILINAHSFQVVPFMDYKFSRFENVSYGL